MILYILYVLILLVYITTFKSLLLWLFLFINIPSFSLWNNEFYFTCRSWNNLSAVSSIVLLGNSNFNLSSYLAGLIEGDGSIITPKTEYSPSGAKNLGQIEITFSIEDLYLAIFIQKKVKGRIRIRGNACILVIKKKIDLYNLITLINGNMRTPKIEALHRIINWYNKNYGSQIPLLSLDNSPLINNSWLSGFFDADGSFYLNWFYDESKQNISKLQYYIRLSQRQMYSNSNVAYNYIDTKNSYISLETSIFSYWSILYKIASLLSVNVKSINRLRKTGYIERAFEVRSTNYISNYIIMSYFLKFPLYSYKYNNIKLFIKLIQIIKSSNISKKEINEYLKEIKKEMNSLTNLNSKSIIEQNQVKINHYIYLSANFIE